MHAGKAYVPRHGLGINKVLVRLTRKADDDIGGDGELRRLAAQRGDHLEIIPAAIEAPHAFQDAVAAGLERDVQVTAKAWRTDRKSTRLNSSHANISYAVFCLKKKKIK